MANAHYSADPFRSRSFFLRGQCACGGGPPGPSYQHFRERSAVPGFPAGPRLCLASDNRGELLCEKVRPPLHNAKKSPEDIRRSFFKRILVAWSLNLAERTRGSGGIVTSLFEGRLGGIVNTLCVKRLFPPASEKKSPEDIRGSFLKRILIAWSLNLVERNSRFRRFCHLPFQREAGRDCQHPLRETHIARPASAKKSPEDIRGFFLKRIFVA